MSAAMGILQMAEALPLPGAGYLHVHPALASMLTSPRAPSPRGEGRGCPPDVLQRSATAKSCHWECTQPRRGVPWAQHGPARGS